MAVKPLCAWLHPAEALAQDGEGAGFDLVEGAR